MEPSSLHYVDYFRGAEFRGSEGCCGGYVTRALE